MTLISRYFSAQCNGITLNNLDKAGNYLGTGIGIVLVILGRRTLDGEPGFQGEARAPGSVSSVQERNKAAVSAISNLNATTKVSDSENVHYRQTYGGIPVSQPAQPHSSQSRRYF